jgi:uncharacterized damage-inducible protein DinB
MGIVQGLLSEFKHEASSTRKILERVPDDKNDWAPHEKSMKLRALANHVAELNGWVDIVISRDQLDFAKGEYVANTSATTAETLKFFDEQVAKAISVLEETKDEDLEKSWALKYGDQVLFAAPKKVALRATVFSHIVHHRAQLGVYLRLQDIAVPGIYGPTADEPFMP